MQIKMALSRIIINEINNQQIVFLREIGGKREFPIVVGIFEATSIDRRVKGLPSPRPLTHDLICAIVESFGGSIQDVVIDRMCENTFFATLRIKNGEELIEIDSRPSDAITLAAAFSPPLPIFVDEDVLALAMEHS